MKNKEFLNSMQSFINAESFSGILLFFAMALAIILSNSPISDDFNAIWQYQIGIQSDNFTLIKPLILWINDGLMAIFFFLIGLELKRESFIGELNTLKKAALPVFAALGGMIIPLLLFLLLNSNPETRNGWGISMATDIAFTLAILKLLGDRIPLSLKIFLTAFAIIDDLGAIIVIALFYSTGISWELLFYAGILLSILYTLSYFRIHNNFLLLTFGITVWLLFLKSGIHPTISGILLAFSVPIKQKVNKYKYIEKLKLITQRLSKTISTTKLPLLTKVQMVEINHIEEWTAKVQSPLQKSEYHLHKWIAFFIMPVFAISNAGVSISQDSIIDYPLIFSITISLFVGKTIGVFLFSYLGVKLKIAVLPNNTNFKHIFGVAILSGVGFTMSLFIGGLAFGGNEVFMNSTKIGIMIGSTIAGLIGYFILKSTTNKQLLPK